jgi:hypothetical protein
MAGSAFKTTHTNHRPEHIRQLGCKSAILIKVPEGFRNGSGSFATFAAIRRALSPRQIGSDLLSFRSNSFVPRPK